MDSKAFVNSLAEFMQKNDMDIKPLFKIKTVVSGDKQSIGFDGLQELADRFRQKAREAYKHDKEEEHKVASDNANRCESIYDKWNGRDGDAVVIMDIVSDFTQFAMKICGERALLSRPGMDENKCFTFEFAVGPTVDDINMSAMSLAAENKDAKELN